jgi:hypothetical protein
MNGSENINRVTLATGNDNYQRDSMSKLRIRSANYVEFYFLHAIIYQLDFINGRQMRSAKENNAVGTQVFLSVHMAELKMRLGLTTCVE